jgi:predicted esterase
MPGESSVPLSFAGASPRSARIGLVLLHGRGASAGDILGLGHALGLPDLATVAPQAPDHSWWPSSFLAPMGQMRPYLARGMDAVEGAIAALTDAGLPRDRIALAGFSQGGCLALEYAARHGGLAAVFGLSAGLIGTRDAMGGPLPSLYGYPAKAFDYDTDLGGMPVEITVHAEDPHIPLARAQDSERVFRELGARVRLQVAPGPGHGITEAGIAAMRGHLNQ